MSAKTMVLYGPPGTGKTRFLMGILEEEINLGVSPDRIAYLAFTRRAASEAVSRLPIPPDDVPWCRTLHSLAYRWLGVQRGEIMQPEHYREFGERYGYRFTGMRDETGLFEPRGDNLLLSAVELARTRLTDPAEEAARLGVREPAWAVRQLAKDLQRFKEEENLLDFTDLLEEMLKIDHLPELDVVIIDEAQDLTPLQWRVVQRLAEHAARMYVAGDDDQAVYTWCGADVEYFVNMSKWAKAYQLPKSHRIPRRVQALAQRVVDEITQRVPKVWEPRDEEGFVELGVDLDAIDPAEGTWMFLARTHRQASHLRAHLRRLGRLYRTASGPAVHDEDWAAIKSWEALRKGHRRPVQMIRAILALMPRGVDRAAARALDELDDKEELSLQELRERYGLHADGPWYEVLTRLGREQIDYLRACLANGEREPRCYVGTIHSVKGGEADYVVLCPDIPARVQAIDDAERRVWYVGLTRARKGVYILRPRTPRHLFS